MALDVALALLVRTVCGLVADELRFEMFLTISIEIRFFNGFIRNLQKNMLDISQNYRRKIKNKKDT